ncbi:MAG: rubredoxin, partial [Clostridiales bacterium]|nr:rubredoxin [Clostridiales bacterium]
QYKPEEAKLFTELAEYFKSITSAPEDATIEALSESLKKDIDDYPTVRAAADKDKDRGAARVCVWGEKVTRMLSSILDRYLKEGNSMFEGNDIWICTVCGFIYIGETPPDLCPVCKVESWKFNKSEGRI